MNFAERFWDIVHSLGPNRQAYKLEKARRIGGLEAQIKAQWLGFDLLSFPPAPCNWLCQRETMKRFHFTCLTCWRRRFHFKLWGHTNLREQPLAVVAMRSPSGKQVPLDKRINILYPPPGQKYVLPKRYSTYGIFIPTNSNGQVNNVKAYLIKYLLTLAERIAEL